MNEATARIKINKLLEEAGWRFFAENGKPANIVLEAGASIRESDLDALGNNFEKTTKGYIDFLLLDDKGRPYIVLEAKSEDKQPLVGKEQARKYARSQNCRFADEMRKNEPSPGRLKPESGTGSSITSTVRFSTSRRTTTISTSCAKPRPWTGA